MTGPTDPVPRLDEETYVQEHHDKENHLEALRAADQALTDAAEVIKKGRARLQAAIARYEERARDPR